MPIAPIIDLAQQIADDLTAASLGFTARRGYLPQQWLAALETSGPQVMVIPVGETGGPHARQAEVTDRQIQICVVQKLATGADDSFDQSAIDDFFAEYVEPIKARLGFSRFGDFVWTGTEHKPIYDPQHLEAHRQVTSLLTVTYRTVERAA